jgi:hypothetical protein
VRTTVDLASDVALLDGQWREEDGFGVEPEVIAKLARKGRRRYEVGISDRARTYAEVKRGNWMHGVRAIYAILKYNLETGQC